MSLHAKSSVGWFKPAHHRRPFPRPRNHKKLLLVYLKPCQSTSRSALALCDFLLRNAPPQPMVRAIESVLVTFRPLTTTLRRLVRALKCKPPSVLHFPDSESFAKIEDPSGSHDPVNTINLSDGGNSPDFGNPSRTGYPVTADSSLLLGRPSGVSEPSTHLDVCWHVHGPHRNIDCGTWRRWQATSTFLHGEARASPAPQTVEW